MCWGRLTCIVEACVMRHDLRPNEVAKLLRVSPITVRDWVNKGILKARTTPGGHRRFSLKEIKKFAHSRGIKLENDSKASSSILVVDDNIQITQFLEEFILLYDAEAEIVVAHDGFAAGVKLEGYKPDFVLLDLMMPRLNGFEVCKYIKTELIKYDICVITMTGYFSQENIDKAFAAGANYCIRKPFDEAQLLKLLNMSESIRETEL